VASGGPAGVDDGAALCRRGPGSPGAPQNAPVPRGHSAQSLFCGSSRSSRALRRGWGSRCRRRPLTILPRSRRSQCLVGRLSARAVRGCGGCHHGCVRRLTRPWVSHGQGRARWATRACTSTWSVWRNCGIRQRRQGAHGRAWGWVRRSHRTRARMSAAIADCGSSRPAATTATEARASGAKGRETARLDGIQRASHCHCVALRQAPAGRGVCVGRGHCA
jgi:hypothetical protein